MRPAQRRLAPRLTLSACRGGRSASRTASAAAGHLPYPGCRCGFHRCWLLSRAATGWLACAKTPIRGLRQVPAAATRLRLQSCWKTHLLTDQHLRARLPASVGARGCCHDHTGCARKNGGADFRGRFAMGSCQRALPATPRRLLACLATYFLVPARAGTTSTCSARRLEPEGGGQCQGVCCPQTPTSTWTPPYPESPAPPIP